MFITGICTTLPKSVRYKTKRLLMHSLRHRKGNRDRSLRERGAGFSEPVLRTENNFKTLDASAVETIDDLFGRNADCRNLHVPTTVFPKCTTDDKRNHIRWWFTITRPSKLSPPQSLVSNAQTALALPFEGRKAWLQPR